MTVRELIERLKTCEPDRIVVMAKDAEGNGYSPLHNLWAGRYLADSTYSGEVGEDDEDGVPAMILTPIN